MISVFHLATVFVFPTIAVIGVILALRGRRRAREARLEAEEERQQGAPRP